MAFEPSAPPRGPTGKFGIAALPDLFSSVFRGDARNGEDNVVSREEDHFGMKLYVGNLSYETSEDELRDTFAAYGDVASAKIITDRDTGRSKGFGFIEFNDDDAAKKAMSALNGSDLRGRALTVNEARPQAERPRGGMGGGGGRERAGGGYRGGNRY